MTLFPEQHNINRFAAAASLFGEAQYYPHQYGRMVDNSPKR